MKLGLIADNTARVVSFNINLARNESYLFVHDDCLKFQVKFLLLCFSAMHFKWNFYVNHFGTQATQLIKYFKIRTMQQNGD